MPDFDSRRSLMINSFSALRNKRFSLNKDDFCIKSRNFFNQSNSRHKNESSLIKAIEEYSETKGLVSFPSF